MVVVAVVWRLRGLSWPQSPPRPSRHTGDRVRCDGRRGGGTGGGGRAVEAGRNEAGIGGARTILRQAIHCCRSASYSRDDCTSRR